jgi:TM2 domain-containing membrane protein YozV
MNVKWINIWIIGLVALLIMGLIMWFAGYAAAFFAFIFGLTGGFIGRIAMERRQAK